MTSVTLLPAGAYQATLPHIKAMYVPFHLVYGSLIYFMGLQRERLKCKGLLVDRGAFQTHVKLGYLCLA